MKDQQQAYEQFIAVIDKHIPVGFKKCEEHGGTHYVVPLRDYPKGYHVTPGTPLPFLSVIPQKHHIGVYHMGIYANPELLQWFTTRYKEEVPTKLQMGKSCIRLTNATHIPYELLGELVEKMTPDAWIKVYEQR